MAFWQGFCLLSLMAFSGYLQAREGKKLPIGYITSLEGQAQILSDPRESLEDSDSARALHENLYWLSRPARVNGVLFLKDYIICYQGCRLKANFRNSYTLILGPGSKVRLGRAFLQKTTREPRFIDLLYGSLRAIIRKKADREHPVPEFHTKSAVMGVRGTDFLITSDHVKTVVSVITGEISLKSAIPALFQAEQRVSAGMTSGVTHPPPHVLEKIEAKEIQEEQLQEFLPEKPREISKHEFITIQSVSGGLIENDKGLKNLEKKVLKTEPADEKKAPPEKEEGASQPPLALPPLFLGLMLTHRGGEIETGESLEFRDTFSGHAFEGRVEFFPFDAPVSLGLHLAKVTFNEGEHFSSKYYGVYEMSGWESGGSVGYWLPFSSLYLALSLRVILFSKIKTTGIHRAASESEGSHVEDRYYSIPGLSLRSQLVVPFYLKWHGFFEFAVGEQGFASKEDERSTLPKFHGAQFSLGIFWNPSDLF